jgi:hypothetical protein
MIFHLLIIGALIVIILLVFALGWLAKVVQDDRRQFDAELDAVEKRPPAAEKRPVPRHAVTRPRTGAGVWPPHIDTLNYGDRSKLRELVTTATDIDRVILPAPGSYPPQSAPDLNGADDTGTMDRISVTGEIAKLTDENMAYIERMRLEEAQHRALMELAQ